MHARLTLPCQPTPRVAVADLGAAQPARAHHACAPQSRSPSQLHSQSPAPLQHANDLDHQTTWPVHRIRSFLLQQAARP